jgi:hypothetical protein
MSRLVNWQPSEKRFDMTRGAELLKVAKTILMVLMVPYRGIPQIWHSRASPAQGFPTEPQNPGCIFSFVAEWKTCKPAKWQGKLFTEEDQNHG